ncbi:hypothetical protein LGH82_02570 [Mesorhizobium sp. PAMC28654]|uniref:hypothetical protein n=1 Tax=Mesorhizobium sp. PAMC28654 TaxID=2880934 RepID=UPI001D0B0903|nr:hypothetical protein [Mesorhizobium sp. PAMC28654]UDL90288.1 hypothetical protein LGH82_02570 [Mesorhizobium sp. PAMC28654]
MITLTVYRGKHWDQQHGKHVLTWGTLNWLKAARAEPDGTEKEVPLEQIDSNGRWHDPDWK